jgi:hypothetical protein
LQIESDFSTATGDIQNEIFMKIIHHYTPFFPSFKTPAKSRQICQRLFDHISQYSESRNLQHLEQCEFSLSLPIPVISSQHYVVAIIAFRTKLRPVFFSRSPLIRPITPLLVARASPVLTLSPCSWCLTLCCREHHCLWWADITFDHLTETATIAIDLGYALMKGVSTRPNNIVSVSRSKPFSSMAIPSWTDGNWRFNLGNLPFGLDHAIENIHGEKSHF